MFLKSLSIKGFKSFADATTLVMEPGVTVVVGPNGSGKSNVVDAIGWVLGAQAPSAVRSQKMDDVIFAGTQKRPALGRAEVSLTIDNSSGMLPIEFNEVTITRILFRTGDSEYSINGVPCRLLDIQELLSDSGVGRQQHVIISQGQIDAVLNARPEDRRLIIEEAAGVLKFRRRKEKAERRLTATEGNLTRLQDLLREVRRQLRPLEKQADAARRHGAVVEELTALRVHLAGQELVRLRSRLEAGQRTKATLGTEEREIRTRLRQLDAEVLATEARLSAMGGDDLGDALVRFESLREKARGLAAVLAERSRGIERDRGAPVDADVTANLEADAAKLIEELREVEAKGAELAPAADELAIAESDLAAAREAFQREWSEGAPTVTGAAAEVRGELAAVRLSVDRSQSEATRGRSRLDALEAKLAGLSSEAERLQADLQGSEGAEGPLGEQLVAAEVARRAAEAAVEEAEEVGRQAEAERHSWSARADALALALDQARARAGAERLASIDGVVGTLLDVVEVDPGWEPAFEAAAGEAIAAVVVDSVDSGRRALAELRAGDAAGAVLALGAGRNRLPLGSDGEAVRDHVRGIRPGVDALLDVLVGSCVAVADWTAAVDVALANPDAVVVTRTGDRFGPTGWRVGATGSGATGAALEEARTRADAATEAAASGRDAIAAARTALREARQAETDLSKQLDRNASRRKAAADALSRLERDRGDGGTEVEGLRTHVAELEERARRDVARVEELAARLPALEAEEAAVAEQGRAMAEARSRIDERARAVSKQRSELDVRAAGLDERRQFLERRSAEIDQRLSRHAVERREAATRRVELDRRAAATAALSGYVADRLAIVESELGELRERRRQQTDATRQVTTHLEALRKDRAEAERALTAVRERSQRAEIEEAEVKLRLENAVEALRRDLDLEPERAMAAPAPELPEGVTGAGRVRELERDLRIMGPINPLALEEFQALQERHTFLQDQLEDVKSSRRDLSKVIRAIDAEIVSVFAAAFAEVAQNYVQLFETLFPGGKGKLKLTDPENLLDTGIEVEARPSGKNVRKLSLLSGGERSLVALAYLFAVFRARPSPFYVMDEVEAALDDVNLSRFLGLVQEFRDDAQLIIVSHQKRTMEAADCLYGVTMQPGGSSRVVSEKVND
ncbi:chromosome segregation protein SMC [Aquihabitans sp. G128]|uniref:chromosome segregation protein SMC n=1 Tax=Aquihabitans sp. G128 TaxID=2849779 RepID=UPI001C23C429|nr:chromosome segregation protein SMC [Aquihabitans sp. G128]QXC62637.1 chromosome segregation protein SMC [Aquihabitans sp. G128]